MTILPHLLMSLISVSPYFIMMNSIFPYPSTDFSRYLSRKALKYITFSHILSFLDLLFDTGSIFQQFNHVSILHESCQYIYPWRTRMLQEPSQGAHLYFHRWRMLLKDFPVSRKWIRPRLSNNSLSRPKMH